MDHFCRMSIRRGTRAAGFRAVRSPLTCVPLLGIVLLFACCSGENDSDWPYSRERPSAENVSWPDKAEALTTAGADDWDPLFSPNGTQVAFQTYRYATPDIMSLNLTSGELNPIAMSGIPETRFLWSDSSRFVIRGVPSPNRGRIRTYDQLIRTDLSEGNTSVFEGGSPWYGWTVSPDGKFCVAAGYRTQPEKRFFFRRYEILSGEFTDVILTFPTGMSVIHELALSSGGDRCAMIAETNQRRRKDIFVADMNTGLATRLTDDGGEKKDLLWSPEGDDLAFLKKKPWSFEDARGLEDRERRREAKQKRLIEVQDELQRELRKFQKNYEAADSLEKKQKVAERWEKTQTRLLGEDDDDSEQGLQRKRPRNEQVYGLYTLSSLGGEPEFIFGEEQSVDTPRWHPEGKHIICSAGYAEKWNLHSVNIRKRKALELTLGEWRDFSPTVSPDGSRIVFVSSRSGNLDLFLIRFKGD